MVDSVFFWEVTAVNCEVVMELFSELLSISFSVAPPVITVFLLFSPISDIGLVMAIPPLYVPLLTNIVSPEEAFPTAACMVK